MIVYGVEETHLLQGGKDVTRGRRGQRTACTRVSTQIDRGAHHATWVRSHWVNWGRREVCLKLINNNINCHHLAWKSLISLLPTLVPVHICLLERRIIIEQCFCCDAHSTLCQLCSANRIRPPSPSGPETSQKEDLTSDHTCRRWLKITVIYHANALTLLGREQKHFLFFGWFFFGGGLPQGQCWAPDDI